MGNLAPIMEAPRLTSPANTFAEHRNKVARAPDFLAERGTESQGFQSIHVSDSMKARMRRIPSFRSSMEAA